MVRGGSAYDSFGRYATGNNDMRNSQQEASGVAGEVIFPNTIPPSVFRASVELPDGVRQIGATS
jgi:hypothetical protein